MDEGFRNELERHVRDYGLQSVLEVLATVCDDVAKDKRDNGGDTPEDGTEDEWTNAAIMLRELHENTRC
jgi:hypothetical protein